MRKIIDLPHRVCASTCYINGLEDIFEWKGYRFPDYFLSVMGGMGEFTYLKFRNTNPPEMVYCGANPKYLLKELEKIIDFKQEVIENRTFRYTFSKIKKYIDEGKPVVAGALDMYYLPYFESTYKKQHIPIHYILIVGYDDKAEEILIKDCTYSGLKRISFKEIEKALDVNVKGMSRKNTIRVFNLPERLPEEIDIVRKGLRYRAEKMLRPPVSMFGIPAMKKLSREIAGWSNEASFDHLISYATIPPHIPKKFDNSDGMRQWKSLVLKELGNRYKIPEWIKASAIFRSSGEIFKEICFAASVRDRAKVSKLLLEAAGLEEKAYRIIESMSL
jgi:hypothetical protein